MLDRDYLMLRLKSGSTTSDDFDFDKLTAPPLLSLLTVDDIHALYNIAHSVKYSGNPELKKKMINDIMHRRGFRQLDAGTNRICYAYTESNDFVVKVAFDDIGRGDNPAEFRNQEFLKPFVCKVFEVSPCGTVAVVERVKPIESREEFLTAACKIWKRAESLIGQYVLADFGSWYPKNYGFRVGYGPVLLDFPYVYKIDGKKMYCNAPKENGNRKALSNDLFDSEICGGEIDYDDGFNNLICTKCGAHYKARDLALDSSKPNKIIVREKGEIQVFKIKISGGDLGITEEKTIGGGRDDSHHKYGKVISHNKPFRTGKKEANTNNGNVTRSNALLKNQDNPLFNRVRLSRGNDEVAKPSTSPIVRSEVTTDHNKAVNGVATSAYANKDDYAYLKRNNEMLFDKNTILNNTLEDARAEIADLQKTISVKNSIIDELNKKVPDNSEELMKAMELKKALSDKESEIAVLKSRLMDKDEEINELNEKINEASAAVKEEKETSHNPIGEEEMNLDGLRNIFNKIAAASGLLSAEDKKELLGMFDTYKLYCDPEALVKSMNTEKEKEKEEKTLSGPIFVEGIVKNLKDMYPDTEEDKKVIVLQDKEGELITAGNNELIALDKLNMFNIDDIEIVSSDWYENLKEYDQQKKKAQTEVAVNGVR